MKVHIDARKAPAWVLAALGVVSMVMFAAADARPAPLKRAPAKVVSTSSNSVVFRVELDPWSVVASPSLEGTERIEVPGFRVRGNPGEPARPARKFLVGLPPAGEWTVTWRVLSSEALGRLRLEPIPFRGVERGGDLGPVPVERYEIREDVYDAYRGAPVVTTGAAAWIRRQRVVPVWVEPLTYDPAGGSAVLATSIEITVTFTGGARTDAFDGGIPPAPESPEWQTTFSRMLVNAGQARVWRRPVVIRSQAPGRSSQVVQAGPLLKLKVRETGIHKVTADAAVAAGFPSGRPIGDLHVFKRGYDVGSLTGTVTDVAFAVREHAAGTQGIFDGQDVVVFYALRPAEDAPLNDPQQNLTEENVYWLGTTAGPRMADRVLAPGTLSADTASVSFTATRRFMIDKMFREETPPGTGDWYYFNEFGVTVVNFPFELGAARPGTDVTLNAEIHGAVAYELRLLQTKLVNSKGSVVLDPSVPVPYKRKVDYQTTSPASNFDVGANTFRIERSAIESDPRVNVHLNWLRVTYEALFRARGNTLRFNTATLSGDTSITVTGLSDTDLWLFDVTDPVAPVNCLVDVGLFTPVGGSFALTFRDAITTRKEYILVPQSRMFEIAEADIELDTPSSIIGDPAEGGVDVLVVTHADFAARMGDWARYRRAQGHRVLLVDVEDVYDEFNGGVKGTQAIDRFVRHFFETGNAGYLVLVGDASEDHKRVFETSGPDYVPSRSRSEYIGSGEFDEDEVVTLDKKYVKLPGPGGQVDDYPDLIVGRIPVGSDIELYSVLSKVYLFEKPKASDFWRRRMIVVADDAYKGTNTLYKYYGLEVAFENGQERTAKVVEVAHPGTFEVVRFYLSEHTHALHPNNEPIDLMDATRYVRQFVTPRFLGELSQGATLVTIQAHMNRLQVAHEYLFTTLGSAVPGSEYGSSDHYRCNNRDKPFIIFGMGCHFSDYANNKELWRNPRVYPNGDCFAEQLLFQNREGAVATYGSSGFEYLGEVNNHMDLFSQVWFYEAPYDTMVAQTQGKWVFGQLMFLVEAVVLDEFKGQTASIDRYHILGDPLLRIDAGPPRMEVTINGEPFQSGDNLSTGVDTIHVVANVTDENVIEKFELIVDQQDESQSLDVTPVGDGSIPGSRSYVVSFDHQVRLHDYSIVLRALQAADTTAGRYHMEAEFVINVPSDVTITVNGRLIGDGDLVPQRGDYRVQVRLPTYIPSSEIGVEIDGEDVTGLNFMHPAPEDTTAWIIEFTRTLGAGRHELAVTAGAAQLGPFALVVDLTSMGLRNVVNYPNPFAASTQFVYTNDVEIEDGTIDVFTVSGKKVVRLDIPPDSRTPGQNAVFWDGRDSAGDEIANGVYLYIIRVTQQGQESMIRGKLARMK